MKCNLLVSIVSCALLFALAPRSLCQTKDDRSFDAKLYAITQLDHFAVDPQRLAALSEEDKANLLASREILISLLKAIKNNAPITPYVTTELSKKYKDSSAFAASVLEPETTLLAAGVTNFTMNSQTEIKLDFFAITDSEGTITASETSAVIKNEGQGWRVGRVGTK